MQKDKKAKEKRRAGNTSYTDIALTFVTHKLYNRDDIKSIAILMLCDINSIITTTSRAQFYMTNSQIAKRYGLAHRNTVIYHLKKLQQNGWINIENRKPQSNIITLTIKAKNVFETMQASWNNEKPKHRKKPKKNDVQIDWMVEHIASVELGITEKWDDSESERERKRKILDDYMSGKGKSDAVITVISNELYYRNDIKGFDIVVLADIIQLLKRYEKMNFSRQEMAKKYGMARHTVSRIMQRLQKNGFIEMSIGKKRQAIIQLTEKTKALMHGKQKKAITRASKTNTPTQTSIYDQA